MAENISGQGWYPFPSPDTAVATGSQLKRLYLSNNGITVVSSPFELALVDKGEGINPVVTIDKKHPPFAARTAIRKIMPLRRYLRSEHSNNGGSQLVRATFDSTNDLVGVPGLEGTVVTNKHHGHQGNIDELMSIYQQAVGAEYVSSTGIAVAYSDSDLLRLYFLRLRVGVWDPNDFNELYRVIKDHPDYAGGIGVFLAMKHNFVRTNGHVHLEATRVDDQPDLLLANKNGTIISERIINVRHLLAPIALQENTSGLELILRQLAIGIIPRPILEMISNKQDSQ